MDKITCTVGALILACGLVATPGHAGQEQPSYSIENSLKNPRGIEQNKKLDQYGEHLARGMEIRIQKTPSPDSKSQRIKYLKETQRTRSTIKFLGNTPSSQK